MEIERQYLEIYGFADPAAGKNARSRKRQARQAIVIAGRDWYERWFVLYHWAGIETATSFKNRILDIYDEWQPRRFGIEANGMQVLFGALIREEGEARFGDVRIQTIYQPTNVMKEFRIRTGLEPVIRSGRLFLASKTDDLAVEIRGFPTAATKDLVDALETVISRVAPKMAIHAGRDAELDAYARYLRSSRLPPHRIAEKLATYESELHFQRKESENGTAGQQSQVS